jgi:ferredoxin-NADP reductase
MPAYKVKLKRREEVAERTTAFYFEKPPGFVFRPGQFCNVALLDPPETDAEGNARSFSIASAPFEEDLMLAMRMRDTAFKRVLGRAPLGTEVRFSKAIGPFTLHEDASRPAVFLVGGIGITPFRSMILDAAHKNLPHSLLLFYSNRRPEDAAFLGELQDLAKNHANFELVATMAEMEKSQRAWQGEIGFIRKEMLDKYASHLARPIYYSAGPPAMVHAMRELLAGMGASEDNIRTEDFDGY